MLQLRDSIQLHGRTAGKYCSSSLKMYIFIPNLNMLLFHLVNVMSFTQLMDICVAQEQCWILVCAVQVSLNAIPNHGYCHSTQWAQHRSCNPGPIADDPNPYPNLITIREMNQYLTLDQWSGAKSAYPERLSMFPRSSFSALNTSKSEKLSTFTDGNLHF